MQVQNVLGPACLLVGLGLLVTVVAQVVAAVRRRRAWAPAVGTVLDTRWTNNADSSAYVLHVGFDGPAGPVAFWNRTGSNGGGRIGSTVRVLYNPADPAEATVVSGAHGDVSTSRSAWSSASRSWWSASW